MSDKKRVSTDAVSVCTSTTTSSHSTMSSWKSNFSSAGKADAKKTAVKKPTWMDASLPDKERWKSWEKKRDKQVYGKGGTTGYFSSFYAPKKGGSKVWWIAFFGP